MSARQNFVPFPPSGLVIALQYWQGDEAAAMRLARLLADIEPRRRHDDVMLAFCRRFDTPLTPLAHETILYCGLKFGVCQVKSEREGVGHPDGSFGLWAGTLDKLADGWISGYINAHSVFMVEADGCPVARDWIDRLKREHELTIAMGKRITGAVMEHAVPHVNGGLMMHLSAWLDRPSLHRTPPRQAFDMFHAAVMMAEARATGLILNPYGSKGWTPGVLDEIGHNVCWLNNVKDDSVVSWAERTLVAPRAPVPIGTEDTAPAAI